MTFIVSKSGFLASADGKLPSLGTEIPVGQRLVILLNQHDPDKVRFSWNDSNWGHSRVYSGNTQRQNGSGITFNAKVRSARNGSASIERDSNRGTLFPALHSSS